MLFTFRGPTYGLFQGLGTIPILFDFDPQEMERFCELSLAYRPTGLYNFGSVLINAVREVCERRGFDPRDVFSSYKGVVFAGEPLSPRARVLAEEWGVELFEHTSVGDVTAAFECTRTTACTSGRTPRSSRASTPTAGPRSPTANAASSSPRRCSTASRHSCGTAPTTSCA